MRLFSTSLLFVLTVSLSLAALSASDRMRDLQNKAVESNRADFAHWGTDPQDYTQWGTHSNRLIPIYTFGTRTSGSGVKLADYIGKNSAYRDERKLKAIYGAVPEGSRSDEAAYCDQTDLALMQKKALEAGKKHIFLVVFDGMDWQTTWAAAIYRNQKVSYTEGRGNGLHFQDYQANGTTEFGWMVATPFSGGASIDVNQQTASLKSAKPSGGYNSDLGGAAPWSEPTQIDYLIGKWKDLPHVVPDSAATASSMTSGIKTYNGSILVDRSGERATSVAHLAQEKGYGTGVVSSVPISHATPASAYAHNVTRNDYQDISRDLLGLPSSAHPETPLPGLDVVIGGGFGTTKLVEAGQGTNFIAGNRYLYQDDLDKVRIENGGRYHVAVRQEGVDGSEELKAKARQAQKDKGRLLGFYGVGDYSGHIPYQTADGDYQPAIGRGKKAESYSEEDLQENPTLAEMTQAALDVLSTRDKGFWLLVEAGDVDWANHDNNLDNSIGAVFSGDEAVKTITDWVEANSNWEESVMIVTADHGHYLFLDEPEAIATAAMESRSLPRLMSHRGMNRMAPENTLPAFEAALGLGFDIELDVYLTTDGRLVVIHDETLDRTTNGSGKVYEKTFAEVRSLDAGSWFGPEFRGLKVPTLGEVLRLVKEKETRATTVAINLKILSPGIEEAIVDVLEELDMLDRAFCFMMDAESNDRFRKANPQVRTASMTTGFREWDLRREEDFSRAVSDKSTTDIWLSFLPTEAQLDRARQQGKHVWIYTGSDQDLITRSARSGLSGVCSDFVMELKHLQTK